MAEPTPDLPVPAGPSQVAVVVPAKDEAERIAATVKAAAAIPSVTLVLVVDDGSRDDTSRLAREAGAEVVRHVVNRGKGAAMETGADAVAGRLGPDADYALLFVDADLQHTAAATTPLTLPVLGGEADMTIAVLPRQAGGSGGGFGFVVGLSRRGIQRATGWTPTQPLSGMRCLTRDAFAAGRPLARGWGVETGLTIDLLTAGFRVLEVECALQHRVTGRDWHAQLHRLRQFRDVALALVARRLRRTLRR